jgi:ribA/ribD-fused uncharacterized protein
MMFPQIPFDNRILYFGRDRMQFGFMSHFHPALVELDGVVWPSAEHFYQAQKSFDPAYRRAILEAPLPVQAKRLAAAPAGTRKQSRQSWFKEKQKLPRTDWQEVKLDIMRRTDAAKFAQNEDLRQLLLATADAELIEDSPSDPYWGIGRDGNGLNWAGRVLMEVRESLRCDGYGCSFSGQVCAGLDTSNVWAKRD